MSDINENELIKAAENSGGLFLQNIEQDRIEKAREILETEFSAELTPGQLKTGANIRTKKEHKKNG